MNKSNKSAILQEIDRQEAILKQQKFISVTDTLKITQPIE